MLVAVVALNGCSTEKDPIEFQYYVNDFESSYSDIDGAKTHNFDGSQVLGPYNNDGISIELRELPEHELIRLSFDLFIHDSWDGNTSDSNPDKKLYDSWIIAIDINKNVSLGEKQIFETTFSNAKCSPGWCAGQAFPNHFPFHNEARTGSVRSTFGRCLWKELPDATTVYRINKTFSHRKDAVTISIYDQLKQIPPFPTLCEESWSIDNLYIGLLKNE